MFWCVAYLVISLFVPRKWFKIAADDASMSYEAVDTKNQDQDSSIGIEHLRKQ